MVETTTVRLEKPVVEWLNSLKGFLEYSTCSKMTLNDALFAILGEVEIFYAFKQGFITNLHDKRKLEEFVNRKIKIFWEEAKEKPIYEFKTSKEYMFEKE